MFGCAPADCYEQRASLSSIGDVQPVSIPDDPLCVYSVTGISDDGKLLQGNVSTDAAGTVVEVNTTSGGICYELIATASGVGLENLDDEDRVVCLRICKIGPKKVVA